MTNKNDDKQIKNLVVKIAEVDQVKTRRTYTTSDKMHCFSLYSMGKSVRDISLVTGIPHTTVQSWITCGTIETGVSEYELSTYTARLKSELQSQLILNARRCASLSMEDEKTDKASAKDLAIMTGIFTDKHQLISGSATQIVQHHQFRNQSITIEAEKVRAEKEVATLDNQLDAIDATLSDTIDA